MATKSINTITFERELLSPGIGCRREDPTLHFKARLPANNIVADIAEAIVASVKEQTTHQFQTTLVLRESVFSDCPSHLALFAKTDSGKKGDNLVTYRLAIGTVEIDSKGSLVPLAEQATVIGVFAQALDEDEPSDPKLVSFLGSVAGIFSRIAWFQADSGHLIDVIDL